LMIVIFQIYQDLIQLLKLLELDQEKYVKSSDQVKQQFQHHIIESVVK
jgi:hypothetical protein